MTFGGGANDLGVLFEYDPVSSAFVKKLDFAGTTNGSYPWGNLTLASNGKLYGMTSQGGAVFSGLLFEFDPLTSNYVKKLDFNFSNGSTQLIISLVWTNTTLGPKG